MPRLIQHRINARTPCHIDEIIARGGGPVLPARIHDHLTAYVDTRPNCVLVPTGELDAHQTYDAVIAALAEPGCPSSATV